MLVGSGGMLSVVLFFLSCLFLSRFGGHRYVFFSSFFSIFLF